MPYNIELYKLHLSLIKIMPLILVTLGDKTIF